jgi:hypothetical protein
MAGENDTKYITEGQQAAQRFTQAKDVNERLAASKALYDSIVAMQKATPDLKEMQRLWNLQTQAFSQAILGQLTIGDQNHEKLKIVGTTADANHSGLVVAVGGESGRTEKFFVLGADGLAHEATRTDKGIVMKEGGKVYNQQEVEQMALKNKEVSPAAQPSVPETPGDFYQYHKL